MPESTIAQHHPGGPAQAPLQDLMPASMKSKREMPFSSLPFDLEEAVKNLGYDPTPPVGAAMMNFFDSRTSASSSAGATAAANKSSAAKASKKKCDSTNENTPKSGVFLEITSGDALWTYAVDYISKHLEYNSEKHKTNSLRAQPDHFRKGPDTMFDEVSLFFSGRSGLGAGSRGMKSSGKTTGSGGAKKKKVKDEPKLPHPKLGLGWHSFSFEYKLSRPNSCKEENKGTTRDNVAHLEQDHAKEKDKPVEPPALKKQKADEKEKGTQDAAEEKEVTSSIRVPITLVQQRIGEPVASERGTPAVLKNIVLFCERTANTDRLKASIEQLEEEEKRKQQELSASHGGAPLMDQSLSALARTKKQEDRIKENTCSASFALLYLCKLFLSDSQEKKENQVSMWRFDLNARYWIPLARRWARSMDSVVVEEKMKKLLLDDLSWFERDETRAFYKEHGIPYHRCYLLHGPPGAGKTSLIYALAGFLERNLAFLQVSPQMTDDTFRMAMEGLPLSAMLVMEDVDSMFTHDREASNSNQKSALSFSGFLNTLDGLAAPDNLITFLTTNHPEKLDPAVLRPGRIDLKIEFKPAGKEVATRYFKTFYKETDLSDYLGGGAVAGEADEREAAALNEETATSKSSSAQHQDEIKLTEEEKKQILAENAKIQSAAEKFGNEVGGRLGTNKLSMAQLQHFFLQCHRLEKDAEAAANWVSEFRFEDSANVGSTAGTRGNGMYC
ncbi:unnamed protein product [Amoebophrya sp. A120]|nr:unnamed protein product [Amoebophrya sp. A120]|eukprot:GSA120T00009325001.1